MQDGKSYDNKGSNAVRPCAYVCIDSAKRKCVKMVGRIKGKGCLKLFDRPPEYKARYSRHFWARRYYYETVGNVNEATITQYIEERYERDRLEREPDKARKYVEPFLRSHQ